MMISKRLFAHEDAVGTFVPWVLFAAFFVSACHGVISGGNEQIEPCPDGAVIQSCDCGGESVSSGYCCSQRSQSYGCDVGACEEGAVISECLCGGELVSDGNCCSGEYEPRACELPACDLGEVLFDCSCGGEVVSAGYCCRDVHQDEACSFNVYYVSHRSGSDDNLGTSASLPWKSLERVNTVTLRAGDAVLFRRGDVWKGTITVSASGTEGNPITYGAYGTGPKPMLLGLSTVDEWTSEGGALYSSSLIAESAPQMVLIDGVVRAMGRWPNAGYHTLTSGSEGTELSDDVNLTGTPNWTGAEVVIRTTRWTLERRAIESQSTSTLTFAATDYAPRTGFGYFIQSSLSALDEEGEWFYDAAASRIYMYFASSDPTTRTVEVSTIDKGIVSSHKRHIIFDGIHLRGMNTQSIYLWPEPNDTTVQNCEITYSGGNAVLAHYPNGCEVKNSTINYTNNCAVWFSDRGGAVGENRVINNTISNTGTIAGAGGSNADGDYSAIVCKRRQGVVEYNHIVNTGYIPIKYGGENTFVGRNFIDTYCHILDDGGGIYCWDDMAPGKQVLNNIVMNAVGATDGTTGTSASANGLYADGFSEHIFYSGNTLVNIASNGFHSNIAANMDITLVNNTFYAFDKLISLQRWKTDFSTGFRFTDNIAVTTALNSTNGLFKYNVDMSEGGQMPLYNDSLLEEAAHLGVIDLNYYYSDIDKGALLYCSGENPQYYQYTNAEYQENLGYDVHSTFVTGISDPGYYLFEYNATTTPKTVELLETWMDVEGRQYSGHLTLEPYSSIVLLPPKVNNVYYLSPAGSDEIGDGSIDSPWFSLNKAWTQVSAGDTVYLRGGVYEYNVWQNLTGKSGTVGNHIRVFAYPGEKPSITRGSAFGNYSMIYVSDSAFLHFNGIEISHFEQKPDEYPLSAFAFMNVNYCIWENIDYHHNAASAWIRGNSTGNLMLRSDFHHNFDPYSNVPYGGGDGAAIQYINEGLENVVRECRFWSNSDDGIDLWENDGNVIIDQCWFWKNGYREDGVTTGGDGAGIKLGKTLLSDNTTFNRTVTNCLAFDNRTIGITSNASFCKMHLYNNTAYGNAIGFYHSGSWGDAESFIRNNVAYGNSENDFQMSLPSAIIDHNSWNGDHSVDNSDFVSLDSASAAGPRQADGSLPDIDFLELASDSDLIDAGIDVGIPFVGDAPDLGAYEYNP